MGDRWTIFRSDLNLYPPSSGLYLCKLDHLPSTCRCAWGPIQTVTMPSQGQDWEAGSNARVSGWGTLSSGGSSPDTLNAVNVPVVSDADCAVS